jgi:Sulfotransferase domain
VTKTALPYVEQCFVEFQAQYKHQNFGNAFDAFVQAIWADPAIAFRYFMVRASGELDACLGRTLRAPEIGDLLAEHPDMHLLVDYDPELISRLVDLRESNIAKGLPSMVVVTQGKSASIPIANIFNSGFNLPSFAYSLSTLEVIESWARDYARGGACYTTHLLPKPHNIQRFKQAGIRKVIVHVRDPRQSILSMMHHVTRYPDQLVALARSKFDERATSEQIGALMEFYVSSIRWIQGWINAEAELDIMFSTFEDFARDRTAFTRRYIEFYGGHEEHFSWDNAMHAHAGTDQHFRSGLVDEWRSVFPPGDAQQLTACIPKAMRDRFGWPD